MGIALPFLKENNEWHSVSRVSYLWNTLGSLDDIQSARQDYYLRIFTNSRKREKSSSNGCVSCKGSWHVHSSHYSFPAPRYTTHIATVNYRGAGEVCKLTQEKGGESLEGGLRREKETEGRGDRCGRQATCHSINMTVN